MNELHDDRCPVGPQCSACTRLSDADDAVPIMGNSIAPLLAIGYSEAQAVTALADWEWPETTLTGEPATPEQQCDVGFAFGYVQGIASALDMTTGEVLDRFLNGTPEGAQ